MKIVFDLTPLYDHLTGVERYNMNITKSIILHHPEDEYVLLFKNEIHVAFKEIADQPNVTYKILPECNKLLFIQLRLLSTVKKIKADYYVFLSFTSPILFHRKGIINAIHDLTCWDCPETIPNKMVYYYRFTNKLSVLNSWKIVTVSKFSQRKICQKYNLSEDDVPVIYDGLTDIFKKKSRQNSSIKDKYHMPNRYILSLSTIEPRKNLQLLIRAYKELIEEGNILPDLVLAGRKGWKLDKIIQGITEEIQSKIHFTGFVDDEDLPQIYKNAELFIFPSKYEGFGLPVIEAMSQGTLVLCSDAASLPEIVDGNGLMFQSENLQSLKDKILEYRRIGEPIKEKMKETGKMRAYSFNWNIESEKLYKLLKENEEY